MNSVLNYAKSRSSNPDFWYEFKCQQVYSPPGSMPTLLNTTRANITTPPYPSYPTNSLLYLTAHSLSCPAGAALRRFQLQWSWQSNEIWYRYECLDMYNLPTGSACTTTTTSYDISTGNLELYRYTMSCAAGKMLTGFYAQKRSADSYIAYTYTCC